MAPLSLRGAKRCGIRGGNALRSSNCTIAVLTAGEEAGRLGRSGNGRMTTEELNCRDRRRGRPPRAAAGRGATAPNPACCVRFRRRAPVHRGPVRHHAVCAEGTDHLRARRHAAARDRSRLGRGRPASDRRTARSVGVARHRRQTANPRRRGRDQPVRSAPRRLGRDARPRHGHPRGDRPRRGDPFRRPGAEERHRSRSVQAADRQPRHAWRHHRDHPESAARARGDRHARASRPGRGSRRRRAVGGAGFAVRRLGRRLAARRGGRSDPRRLPVSAARSR